MGLTSAVRQWMSTSRVRTPSRSRSRVPLAAVVDPPVDVLRALRELDRNLDLYILPNGRVWLLQYQENKHRIAEGRKMIELAREDGGEIEEMRAARLQAAGFACFGEFSFHEGTSAGFLVRRASEILNAKESDVKAEMAQRRAFANSQAQAEERARVIQERIRSSARSDWGWAYRGRKSFSRTM